MTRLTLVMATAAAFALTAPAPAMSPTLNLKSLLGNASDNALTQLEQPGAFYADKAIRIGLPGKAKKLGGILKFADQAGLTGDLTKSLNDAAGLAAGAAKPVFRNAIDQMTLTDGVSVITGGGRAGTDYLKSSSGTVLEGQLRPLVVDALGKTGAYKLFDKMGKSSSLTALGISSDGLTDSVTKQTANGIFQYMGNEETKLRKNPLKILGL